MKGRVTKENIMDIIVRFGMVIERANKAEKRRARCPSCKKQREMYAIMGIGIRYICKNRRCKLKGTYTTGAAKR